MNFHRSSRESSSSSSSSFSSTSPFFLHSQFLHLLLLLAAATTMTSATLYRIGSDVTITCSKQANEKGFFFDPSLDVNLASTGSAGGFVTLFTGSSPRPETDMDKWVVEAAGDNFIYTLSSATLADAGVYKCNNIIDDLHSITIVGGVVVCPSIDAATAGYAEGTILDEICTLDKAGGDPIKLVWRRVDEDVDDAAVEQTSAFDEASSTLKSTMSFNLSTAHHEGAFECALVAPDAGFEDLRCGFGPIDVKFPVRAEVDELLERDVGTVDVDVEGGLATLSLSGNPPPVAERVVVDADSALAPDAVKSSVLTNDATGDVIVSLKVASEALLQTPLNSATVNVTYDGVVVKRITFYPTSVSTGGGSGGGGSGGAIAGVIVALVLIAICGVLLVIFWKKRILFGAKEEEQLTDDAEKGLPIIGEEKQPSEEVKMTEAEEETKNLVGADSTEKPDSDSADKSPSKPSETAA